MNKKGRKEESEGKRNSVSWGVVTGENECFFSCFLFLSLLLVSVSSPFWDVRGFLADLLPDPESLEWV